MSTTLKASPVDCWMLTNALEIPTTMCFAWIFKPIYCLYLLHGLLNTDLLISATRNNQK